MRPQTRLEAEREQHHRKAEKGYETLRKYISEAETSHEMEKWICSLIDFQQNLPVPTIKTGDMFYSRMLWTYNVGIYDASTSDGMMYLWDETQARREAALE